MSSGLIKNLEDFSFLARYLYICILNIYGGCSSVGRISHCGCEGHGFKSHYQLFLFFICKEILSKLIPLVKTPIKQRSDIIRFITDTSWIYINSHIRLYHRFSPKSTLFVCLSKNGEKYWMSLWKRRELKNILFFTFFHFFGIFLHFWKC